MIYKFKDLYNPKLYDDSSIVYVTGKYNVFNNIVIDKFIRLSKGDTSIDFDTELFEEFGLSDTNLKSAISNTIDTDTFFDTVYSPPITGKWLTIVDYNTLTKAQLKRLQLYQKDPSPNGILIIRATEYRDYKSLLKDRFIATSNIVNLIQLSFPNRDTLNKVVRYMFKQRNIIPHSKAVDLFIMRMSSNYNAYTDIMDNIMQQLGSYDRQVELDYDTLKSLLKGVQFYLLDDFILTLTLPMKSKNIQRTRKVYSMEQELIYELGHKGLVYKLRSRVDELIEMRIAINKGYIPIRVKYSTREAKERIGENSRLHRLSNYSFKHTAYIASQTSLKDWLFIRLLLEGTDYERIIHTIVNRYALSRDRILNNLTIKNDIDNDMLRLNLIQH